MMREREAKDRRVKRGNVKIEGEKEGMTEMGGGRGISCLSRLCHQTGSPRLLSPFCV